MTATMHKSDFQKWLLSKRACEEAREWAADRTAQQSWDECERADWLLWWVAKAGVDRKSLVRAACQCARRSLRFVPAGELRPLRAIEAAESWSEGRATIADVHASAAYAAYSYAAYAASVAASAAASAAASHPARAARASAAAAAAAAYQQKRSEELKAMCSIVRDIIPFPGC